MLFLIARQARSNDPSQRKRAAEKLGAGSRISGDALPRQAALLLELAGDADTDVRIAAFESLGRIGNLAVVSPMAASLKDIDKIPEPAGTTLRETACRAFQSVGQPAVPALISMSKDKNAKLRELAVVALSGIGAREAEPALVAALQDSRSSVRQAAIRGLARTAAAGTIGALAGALEHRDPATRKSAIDAIADVRSADATRSLRRVTKDGDRTVREAAVRALAKQGSVDAVEGLLEVFEGADRELRQLAATQLKDLEWQPTTPSQRALRAVVRGEYQAAAAEGSAAVEPLSALLADKQPGVRKAAAEALGQTRDAGAVRPLLLALQDSDASVKHAAADALVRIGGPAVEPIVCAVHEAVRSAAPEIVVAIGADAAVPLVDLLERGEPYEDSGAEGGRRPVIRVAEEDEAERAQQAAQLLRRLLSASGSRLDRSSLARTARLRDVVRVREVMPTNRREMPTTVVDTVVDCTELREQATGILKGSQDHM